LPRRRWAAVIASQVLARITTAVKLRTTTADVDPLAIPAKAVRRRTPAARANAPSLRFPGSGGKDDDLSGHAACAGLGVEGRQLGERDAAGDFDG
jgi:hypothetical protein